MFSLNSTLKKILVVFLIIALTYANLALIGTNLLESLNSYAVEEQEETANPEESLTEGEENENPLPEEEKELLVVNSKDIHKTKISEDGKVEFNEKLEISLDKITNNSNLIIEDILNEFYNEDETLNEETSIKYNKTIMNKKELLNIIGEEGKFVVKDIATEKILVELTSETINAQTIDEKVEQKFNTDETEENEEVRTYVTVKEETIEIEYAIDVENIKFELNNITGLLEEEQSINEIENEEEKEEKIENEEEVNTQFIIENTIIISNINDTENIAYLKQNKKVTLNEEENNIEKTIKFKDTITRANLTIDNTEWVLGQTNTVKYTITLDTTSEKSELFVNPMFLIEMPSSVESINTANSEFTLENDNGVFYSKKVFATTILERKVIAIMLEGEQTLETLAGENVTINLTLELNIADSENEGAETTKLYYQNDTVTAYESEKSFDTAQVTVDMIKASEPKDEIEETIEDLHVSLTPSTEHIIEEGQEFKYIIDLYNFGNKTKQNLQINTEIQEGISIVKIVEIEDDSEKEVISNFNDETRVLTINVAEINGMITSEEAIENTTIGYKRFEIVVKADELPSEVYSKEIKSETSVIENDTVLAKSEQVTNTISGSFLSIETNKIENVKEGEEIVLEIKATNKGLITKTDVNISINVPEEMTVSRYVQTMLSEEGESEGEVNGTLNGSYEKNNLSIQAGKTYCLQLIGWVDDIDETKQITINGNLNETKFSWVVEVENVEEEPGDSETPDEPGDNTENPSNPSEKPDDTEQPTNPDDTNQPSKPDDTGNNGENGDNTNIGTEETVFDLSLNQYLNKVTVTNSKGTTTYEYKDTNFAKVEIHSKQMNGSKVTFEYKIVVKNEGTVPGYARKIVDYLPEDLKFDAKLNDGWYLGEDGNIYNVDLIDKILNPGETAEVKIVLEKEMTNENTGTTTNIVEIYEASNDKNIEDINSIPGDKVDGQNDMSKVEVMIVTSTGTIIIYTTLAILVLAILGIGFYKVKKITLNKKGGC